jgi:hypothetical protein
MLVHSFGVAVSFRMLLLWKLARVMPLARAAEDEQTGRQRDTGPAKKKSHNASESKRPGSGGARGKLGNVLRFRTEEHHHATNCRVFLRRFSKTGRSLFIGLKLKGLSVALL